LQVEFYQKPDSTKPAEEFLDELDLKMRSKMFLSVTALKEFGEMTRLPYSKHLEDGIFELRAKQGSNISRVLYFFVLGNKAILTNGFIKKSEKTPKSVIETAKGFRREYMNRGEKND
jgi:phage-related protein